MTDLQDALREYDQKGGGLNVLPVSSPTVTTILDAVRQIANRTEIRYCLWHERRAADDSGDDDSGLIVTRFCSSQDGSHDCVVETRLLLDVTKDTG